MFNACANCGTTVVFGGRKHSCHRYCSKECEDWVRHPGFCEVCLAATTDHESGGTFRLNGFGTCHRKTAAELIQRFPEVVEPLRDGKLCLSSVCELAKVITAENRADVLRRFFHASKQEARAVAAEIAPLEVVPQRLVVTVPAPPAVNPARARAGASALELGQPFHLGETDSARSSATARPDAVSHSASASPRTAAEPLTGDLRRLHATVSKAFMRKLAAARDALSHSHPGADEVAILEAGLDLILERAAKRKGIVARPRSRPSGAGNTDPRFIPAAVRREVWMRDGGKCQWPTADGGICGSTHRLHFDHVVPVARGGESSVQNLRVACALHNDLAARQVFGDGWMDRFTRGARRSGSNDQCGERHGAS